MAKQYDNDFKVMIVELLLSGNKAKDVGDEYNINANMIRRWKREFEEKAGDFTKKKTLTNEELEIKTLRKELKNVKLERDILKKAVSIFSKSDN